MPSFKELVHKLILYNITEKIFIISKCTSALAVDFLCTEKVVLFSKGKIKV